MMNRLNLVTGRKCSSKRFVITYSVILAFVVFVYTTQINVIQEIEAVYYGKLIPSYASYLDNHNHRMHYGSNNGRTLSELMSDKDASPEFSHLANVTLNRRGLSNYYLHGSGKRDDYYKSNIAFIHLHKAGGSTTKMHLNKVCKRTGFASILMAHYGTTKVYDRFLKGDGVTSKQTVFVGGYTFGICDVLQGRPCSYMTVLRDPYDRIISAYFFCYAQNPPLCGPVRAKNVSITAWAIHQGSHFFNLLLTDKDTCRDREVHYDEYVKPYQERTKDIINYVPGLHPQSCWFRQKAILKERVTSEQRHAMLIYILDHLEYWLGVIGLVEDYQASLKMFREAYHLPFKTNSTVVVNKGRVRDKTEDARKKQMRMELLNSKEVREALYEDIMIYEKAKQIFKLQKEEFSRLKDQEANFSKPAD
eukprot:XP_011684277.1 PREDICTED: uncharacterized protein LOC105447633 [Strongylocentrotus purpuratus]